jgi:putative CRISPR-associated protein (TIGR02619 family)
MRTIITTVGTSLLTNRDDRPWRWRFGAPFPPEQTIAKWLPTAHPTAISAETHTWYRLGTFESGPTTQIVLIHSATSDGQFCAEQLRQYAESKSLKAECRQVKDLSYADADTFNRGLGQLVRVIAEAIHQ